MKHPNVCYIKRDRQERFNTKRAWFVTAWRVVDEAGRDLIQPWMHTKAEAVGQAKRLGYLPVALPNLTAEELTALRDCYTEYGPNWKAKLREQWEGYWLLSSLTEHAAVLRRLRNTKAPEVAKLTTLQLTHAFYHPDFRYND